LDILPVVVVEYIGPEDPQFRRLLPGRDEWHRDLDQASSEAACRRRLEIARAAQLEDSSRRLDVLRKRKKRGAPRPRSYHA